MVRTIIRNLVANGVKFTNPGGKVTINASILENLDKVEVCVTDTGVGIKSGDIDGLFCIDVKKTTRGTENEKGTGLGLILCKEFIEKNNGSIEVTSEPGKGSCFKFSLPFPYGMED
jgi:two-component system, sensor histidine kinase and response regulator